MYAGFKLTGLLLSILLPCICQVYDRSGEMLCMSCHHPPGCSWQQGLCVQSSSWTGTPYLRQSDDSTTAAVEEEMVEQALQDCIITLRIICQFCYLLQILTHTGFNENK